MGLFHVSTISALHLAEEFSVGGLYSSINCFKLRYHYVPVPSSTIHIYFCYLSGNKEYHYFSDLCLVVLQNPSVFRGHRCRDRMVLGFISTYAINVYDHNNCEFEPRSLRGVLDTTICDKVCQ
jgi:hypothetical protein